MIKQLLKIIWEQRRSNLLICIELLLVSIFLWMVMDQLYGFYRLYKVPKGFDIENTYSVSIQLVSGRELSGEASADSLRKAYEEPFYAVMDKIRRNANVESASACIMSSPYNVGGSWSYIGIGKKKCSTYLRFVDQDFFKVFRIAIPFGKGQSGVDNSQVVISKTIADTLFGGSSGAIGRCCSIRERKVKIVGVTDTYKYYDFADETPTSYHPFAPTFKEKLGDVRTPEICIRLKSNAPADAIDELRKELSDMGDSPYYVSEITSFDKLRDRYFGYTGDMKALKTSASIIIFFLINVFLGVVGTFWFRTEQRKNEIGLRLAIGSTGKSIRGYFVMESILLMVLAAIPAILITIQLRIFDVQIFKYWNGSWGVFVMAGITSFTILLGMVILGTWIPVRKASKIQPSEALHYE